jgi:hypothetical protein
MHGTSSALIPIAGALSNARYLHAGEHLHAAALNHCRNIVRSRVSHGGPHLHVLLPRKMNGSTAASSPIRIEIYRDIKEGDVGRSR